ncbi:MAG TPA: transglutaminase-like domain-containing protein, partial [Opitutaceae bacterium]
SKEPGHCELFAGAFTMLARAEGFPCRVVAGFLGGDWNGDYLIVKNSHAHAWCEMLDADGDWVRVDPTVAATNQDRGNVDPLSDFDARAKTATGWSERWDKVRMLWYRHIVNFDQQDQVNIVKTFQGQTDASVQRARVWLDWMQATLRRLLQGPWNWARWQECGEGIAVVGLTIWLIYRLTHAVSTSRWAWRRRKADPIRAEAARWLAKLSTRKADHLAAYSEIHDALQRIRFGRRETWPEVARTFRDARRVVKQSRALRER